MAPLAAIPRKVANLFRRAYQLLRQFGLRLDILGRSLAGLPRFWRQARAYRAAAAAGPFPLRWREINPILTDNRASAGIASKDYFHQDLWAARLIHQRRPARHVDVGSRVDGFVAHLLTFMPVDVLDIRPLASEVEGLNFIQADATRLERFADASLDSISSLHAVEHFGLGRYGDPVDPGAHRVVMSELARVLKPGGRLYFSVPVGRQRVEFNAHRVFDPQTVIAGFPGLELVSFAVVDDAGRLVAPANPGDWGAAVFACGLFEFTKPGSSVVPGA